MLAVRFSALAAPAIWRNDATSARAAERPERSPTHFENRFRPAPSFTLGVLSAILCLPVWRGRNGRRRAPCRRSRPTAAVRAAPPPGVEPPSGGDHRTVDASHKGDAMSTPTPLSPSSSAGPKEEIIISADSHVMEHPEFWWRALHDQFGDQTPRYEQGKVGRRQRLPGAAGRPRPPRAHRGDGRGRRERRGALPDARAQAVRP